MTTDLTHRERSVLAGLHRQQNGLPAAPCLLTADEYAGTVLVLQTRGLCGADVRRVWDDPWDGPAYLVDRVWLTTDGRDYAAGL